MKAEDASQPTLRAPAQGLMFKKVGEKTQAYLAQRFQGDGVRYKAKLIGVDDVPGPQGDKMSLDSMMKLKGQELAGRQRGLHKQRVWLKVSDTCVQIIDERSGAVEHRHELEKISFVKKDDSEPRAFSYIYGHEGTFKLFYIKMTNLADPVIVDFKDACQIACSEKLEAAPTQQKGKSLLLDEQATIPQMTSSQDELMDIFSSSTGTSVPSPNMQFSEAGTPTQIPWASHAVPAFYSQTTGAPPFNLPSPTGWGQPGQPGIPSPSGLGPWGSAGPWVYQQAASGWSQASVIPQAAVPPLGIPAHASGFWGQSQAGYFATADPNSNRATVTLATSGEPGFPSFSST